MYYNNNSKMRYRMTSDMSLEEDPYMPEIAFADHIGKNEHQQDVIFQKFSRIASAQEMEDFEEVGEFSLSSPDSGVHDLFQMDPETRARKEQEWTTDLAKTEEEINTLRQVLSSKIRHMQELKRKLGITVWKEFKDDMEQGIRNIQESNAYQKTSSTLKTASEKTSEALGSISASVSKKLEEVKQSQTFKNIEEKVGSAYTSVKSKVSGTNQSVGQSEEKGQNGGEPLIEKTESENPPGNS